MNHPRLLVRIAATLAVSIFFSNFLTAQGTRLLRQPNLSGNRIVFVYGSDLWISDRTGGDARRLTSTPAVESDPHFSPDGSTIAFTSNRSGSNAVYVVPIEGGATIPSHLVPGRILRQRMDS